MSLPDLRAAALLAAAALPGTILLALDAPALLHISLSPALLRGLLLVALPAAAIAAALLGALLAPALGLRAFPDEPLALRPLAEAVLLGAAVALALPAAPDLRAHLLRLTPTLRLLYGGVTEELLIRWGLTSLALVATRRVWPTAQRAAAAAAVLLAAAAYAAGHVLVLDLPAGRLAWTLGATALLSAPFGYLYVRWSLATAIAAHLVFHATLLGLAA